MGDKPQSQLFDAVQTFVDVFTKYAAKDGGQGQGQGGPSVDEFMMSKGEFKEMMQKEFGCKAVKDQATLDAMMNDLDKNKDGQLHFAEFVPMVTEMTMKCYLCDLLRKIHEQAEQMEQEKK